MRQYLVIALYFIYVGASFSALPPKYKKTRDLETLSRFVESHPIISSGFISIDIRNHKIYFGDGCVAEFKRKEVIRLPGWVGPAEPLVFSKSTCPVD